MISPLPDVGRFAQLLAPVHEAGHAVASTVLGVPVAEVVLNGDGSGVCHVDPATAAPRRAQLVVLLAGACAVGLAFPDHRDFAVAGGGSDFAQAERLVAEGWAEGDKRAVMVAGFDAAERLLADHWGAVEAVAEALAERGRLTGGEVARLVGTF